MATVSSFNGHPDTVAVVEKSWTILRTAMCGFMNRNEFNDVWLAIEGVVISAHKIVLAAYSPYFHQLLLSAKTVGPPYCKTFQIGWSGSSLTFYLRV